ncbi:MAG: hypothetical protein QOD00_1971 [Blastocatellia bacterium]|jgi:Zn-dependent protease with chaperone function|nr:hypothetical protein [Blastocatellia bacterium]
MMKNRELVFSSQWTEGAAFKRSSSSPVSCLLSPVSRFVLAFILLLTSLCAVDRAALAQGGAEDKAGSHSERARPNAPPFEREMVERAMSVVCIERSNDPLGSVPIDEMQARPSLPLAHPDAVAGAHRAQRLLPVARELAIAALRQLAREYNIEDARIRVATGRINAVQEIEPDMDLRDNASVTVRNPRTIHFGTIFLAGLRSDEGMISVLAHEITHIADGKEDTLHILFRLVGRRASGLTGIRTTGQRAEELTCDLIGAMAARAFIERTPSRERLVRRLARAVEHNCVDEDDTDDDHLSPRNTMRSLLSLDQTLTRDLSGNVSITASNAPAALPAEKPRPQTNH